MSNIRKTCYLTPENIELWRKASYLENKGKIETFNKALKKGFEEIIKEYENTNKK